VKETNALLLLFVVVFFFEKKKKTKRYVTCEEEGNREQKSRLVCVWIESLLCVLFFKQKNSSSNLTSKILETRARIYI